MEADRASVAEFVIDASVALVWFLPDETHVYADRVLERTTPGKALAPDIFWHEMRNVLMISFRRQRISRADVLNSMHRLEQLEMITGSVSNWSLILKLAERHALTAYDAAYLALAVEQKLPLATLDKKLLRAAAAEDVLLEL